MEYVYKLFFKSNLCIECVKKKKKFYWKIIFFSNLKFFNETAKSKNRFLKL